MRRKTSAVLVTALLALSVVFAPGAYAADASMERDMFLATRSDLYGGYTTLRQYDREIFLAEGTYAWTHRWTAKSPPAGGDDSRRVLFIGEGTYYWNCYVTPRPSDIRAYDSRCYLRLAGSANAFTENLVIKPAPSLGNPPGQTFSWRTGLTRV